MEIIAGIDYGRKRIGIAVSDGLGITSQPLEQIEVEDREDAAGQLSEVLKRENVTKMVFGLPRNMNGTEGGMAEEVREFALLVSEKSSIPHELFDERLTSIQAGAVLNIMNVKGKKKKKKLDMISAQILLQCYMDSRRSGVTDT